jgi:hypothetical protein
MSTLNKKLHYIVWNNINEDNRHVSLFCFINYFKTLQQLPRIYRAKWDTLQCYERYTEQMWNWRSWPTRHNLSLLFMHSTEETEKNKIILAGIGCPQLGTVTKVSSAMSVILIVYKNIQIISHINGSWFQTKPWEEIYACSTPHLHA